MNGEFDPTQFTTESPVKPDPMKYTVGKLQEYGWSPEVSAGIVGNLFHESGMKGHVWGRGGDYGLAQWTGPRRKALADYATQAGKPADDLDTQIEFLNHELMTSHSDAADRLRNAKTPEEAARVFSDHYERPGIPALGSRVSAAKKAYGLIDRIADIVGPNQAEAAGFDPSRFSISPVEGKRQQGTFDPARFSTKPVDSKPYDPNAIDPKTGKTWKQLEEEFQPIPLQTPNTQQDIGTAVMAGAPEAALVKEPLPIGEIATGAKLGLVDIAQRAARQNPNIAAAAMGYPQGFTPEPIKGLITPGNIDLTARPIVKNQDGSISTIRSMSFKDQDKEILIPTISPDGRIMSQSEAIESYRKTGQHLGVFDNPESATAYAQQLHQEQEQLYAKQSKPEERAKAAGDLLIKELFPQGVPEAKTMEAQVIRGFAESWPGLIALASLQPLGAIGAFAGWGLTEEEPIKGAVKGAALGGALKGMHVISGKLTDPVAQWFSKIVGGATIGGGATAVAGGKPPEIARDALIFSLFEAFGIPKTKEKTISWFEQKGVAPEDIKTVQTADIYSPEFAQTINRMGEKLALPYPPGMGETFEMRPPPAETIRRPGEPPPWETGKYPEVWINEKGRVEMSPETFQKRMESAQGFAMRPGEPTGNLPTEIPQGERRLVPTIPPTVETPKVAAELPIEAPPAPHVEPKAEVGGVGQMVPIKKVSKAKVPDSGVFQKGEYLSDIIEGASAIKMKNGTIYYDKNASSHWQLVEENSLSYDDVSGSGNIINGDYKESGYRPYIIREKAQSAQEATKARPAVPPETPPAGREDIIVYRGGDTSLDYQRGGGEGISVSTNKNIAERFMAPEGGVISEAILPAKAKILREADIPKDLQNAYMEEAKKLANLSVMAPDYIFNRLQKSVLAKQREIVEYARSNKYDAVDFPFEDEIRIIKPGILKEQPTPAAAKEAWEMTREEFISSQPDIDPKVAENKHWNQVRKALERGEAVSPKVVVDYPDLQTKYGGEPISKSIGAEKKITPNIQQVQKLRNLADGLQNQIDAKFNPAVAHQRPTRRRATMVESAYKEGERLQRIQTILRALIDKHESGDIPEALSKITTKTAIEDLLWSSFPKPGISRVHLVDLLEQTKNRAQGITAERRHISAMIGRGDTWIPFTASDLSALEKVSAKSENYAAKVVKDHLAKAKRLAIAGIETQDKWKTAKDAIDDILTKKPTIVLKEVEIKRQEQELIGLKIPGFFPTPRETAAKMVDMADIKPGMDVLEPSAGSGNIADAIKEKAPKANQEVIEFNSKLSGILESKGYNVVGHDFLESKKKYDRIVMNPPFEKGQDIDHIRHAYDSLNPGGRLVSIMSEGPFFRQNKKASSFQEWFIEVGGSSEKLAEKTFAKEVRATGVSGRIVIINKPPTPLPRAEGLTEPSEGAAPALTPVVQKARDAYAKELGITPEKLEYKGDWVVEGEPGQHLFNIMEPTHPQYKSTGAWPIEEIRKPTPPKKSLLDERGAINLSLVTPGLESGVNIKRGIQSLVLPTAKSPEHLGAGEVLGSKLGTMHRQSEIAANYLRKSSKMFDRLGVHNPNVSLEENVGVKFMSDMSQGRPQPPKMQPITTVVTKLFDSRLVQLEKAEVPLENVRENYFPGMWTKESHRAFNQAMEEAIEAGRGRGAAEGGVTAEMQNVNDWSVADKTWVKNRVKGLMASGEGSDKSALSYLTRRPFKGKESFRKGKVFDDIMTGVEFGLESISNNPIDLIKLKLAEMDRSIMANRAIQEWKKPGDVKFNPVTAKVPEDWVKINDKYGTVWGPPIEGEYGRRIMGYYIAKKPVAEIMNNYLSSSLYNSPYFGTAYKAWMAVGNSLNQFQLGVFSAFHAGFTSLETQITTGAEVLKDIYGVVRGNRSIGDLGKTVVKYPTAMINTARKGAKVLAEWNNPQMDVPTNIPVNQLPVTKEARIAQAAQAAEIAGAGMKMEYGLRTRQTEKMVRDWFGGQKVKAVMRSPIVLTEISMKPIMDFLVPRQKAGVFAELVGRITDQNPDKTLDELRPQFRQAWNRVDARLGQVRYDRLFINNAAKNVIQGIIRAPGWTGGTIAEVGGAPKDAAKFIGEWIETGKAPKDIPDRVAYVISLLATMAIANGLMTYAFTGEKPHGMDWWAFRDGGKDDNGNPTRFLFPSYAKDIFAWYKRGAHTLVAKMHPLTSLAGEISRNRDYYNNMIYDEEKGLWNKDSPLQVGKYILKAYTPFWIRGAGEIAERGGGLKETLVEHPGKLIAPQIGVMPATRAYTQTNLDEVMNRYYSRIQITRTPDTAEEGKIRRETQTLVRQGKEEKATEKLQEAVKNKKVDAEKAVDWLMEAMKPSKEVRFKKLPLEWQAKAMIQATPEEEKMLLPLLVDHIGRAKVPDLEKAMPFVEKLIKNKEKAKVVQR